MQNNSDLRADFLRAMRNVANSVTVVTTDGAAGKQGATVSSFCSVSADPPTLLVCLNANSRIYEAVLANEEFCVNVLPGGQSETSQRFAGFHDEKFEDRFEGIAVETGYNGAPILTNATSFVCSLDQMVQSGSHGIFIGIVSKISRGKDDPLIYLNGQYRQIAKKD